MLLVALQNTKNLTNKQLKQTIYSKSLSVKALFTCLNFIAVFISLIGFL